MIYSFPQQSLNMHKFGDDLFQFQFFVVPFAANPISLHQFEHVQIDPVRHIQFEHGCSVWSGLSGWSNMFKLSMGGQGGTGSPGGRGGLTRSI